MERCCRIRIASLLGRLSVVAMLVTVPVAAARGQTAAYASVANPTAKQLSTKSLELMWRAEDEPDPARQRKLYQEGLRLAEQSLDMYEPSAEAHFARFANMGRLMVLDGAVPNPFNLITVNRELNRTLELDPNYADAWAAKGGMHRQLPFVLGGSDRQAEDCFKRAISLDPNAVGARLNLAEIYREKGDSRRGIPLIEEAILAAERLGKQRARAEAEAKLQEFRSLE